MADGTDRYDREEPLSCKRRGARPDDGLPLRGRGRTELPRLSRAHGAGTGRDASTRRDGDAQLARAVVTARYDADGHAQRKARQALAEQLRGLHRRIVGGEL